MLPSNEAVIRPDSQVVMHFTLTLEDGTVVDTTRDDNQPIEFTIGDGTFLEDFELALYGLKAGDKQTIRIGPENTYGFPESQNIYSIEKSLFTDDIQLSPGVVVGFVTPAGDEVAATIMAVEDDTVQVNFNHPLAGHEVTFDVEILTIR